MHVCFVVSDLVSSVLCQEIGWEERLRNDLFCVGCDVQLWVNSTQSAHAQTSCRLSQSEVLSLLVPFHAPAPALKL